MRVTQEPTIKKRGRPLGSTNKLKPLQTQPNGQLRGFRVLHQYESRVVLKILDEEEKTFTLSNNDFVAATIRWGYSTKSTQWPLILVDDTRALIDWKFYG